MLERVKGIERSYLFSWLWECVADAPCKRHAFDLCPYFYDKSRNDKFQNFGFLAAQAWTVLR